MIDFLLTLNWSSIIAAAIMAFGGTLLVWYRHSVNSWRAAWSRVFMGLQTIPELQADIRGIKYFVTPNGGGSLMDLARRLEISVGVITTQLDLLSQTVVAENDTDDLIARFHCSPDGQNIYVNQTYARWLGVGKSELLGWNWLNVLHPDDAARVQAHWTQCRTEHRQYRMLHRVIASNGDVITLSVTCTPIPEEGNALRWIGYARKVTPHVPE